MIFTATSDSTLHFPYIRSPDSFFSPSRGWVGGLVGDPTNSYSEDASRNIPATTECDETQGGQSDRIQCVGEMLFLAIGTNAVGKPQSRVLGHVTLKLTPIATILADLIAP